MVFPQAVDAEGHEVIGETVRGGDRGEDAADWTTLVKTPGSGQDIVLLHTALLLQRLGDRLEAKSV